jgi:hypothetical protein
VEQEPGEERDFADESAGIIPSDGPTVEDEDHLENPK